MQDVVIASLFFKEVAIGVGMLFVWIDPDKASPALILQDRLLDHGVVATFGFRRRPDRKWASLQVFPSCVTPTKTVQFLFDDLGEERAFDDASIFQVLIIRTGLVMVVVLVFLAEAHRGIGVSAHTLILRIVKRLILDVILHFFVLEADQRKKISD